MGQAELKYYFAGQYKSQGDEIMDEKTIEAPNRLWKGEKKNVRLEISFYGKGNAINIGKDVVRILGAPSYICLKVNRSMDSIIITPCEKRETLSFKVPDRIYLVNHVQMHVTSRAFVHGLMTMNDMDLSHTYKVAGAYSEKDNVVIFHLDDKRLYDSGQSED